MRVYGFARSQNARDCYQKGKDTHKTFDGFKMQVRNTRHCLLLDTFCYKKMLLYCIVKKLGSSGLCRVLVSGSLRICRSSNLPPSSRFTFEVVPPAACLLLDTFCYKKNAIVLH